MEMKICKYCHGEKHIELFEVDNRLKDRHTNRCKECRSKQRYENGEYDREKIRKHEYKTQTKSFYTEKTLLRVANATHCEYCSDELNRIKDDAKQINMEHIYYAGSSYGGHNIDNNIAICCRQCNSRKGRSHIYEFYQSFDSFTPELWNAFIKRWIGDIENRPITDEEVDIMTENLREEADELRERDAKSA